MPHPPEQWRRVWQRECREPDGAVTIQTAETFCEHEMPVECEHRPPD